MSKPTIEEILAPKPKAAPRIYAYSIAAKTHEGLSDERIARALSDVYKVFISKNVVVGRRYRAGLRR